MGVGVGGGGGGREENIFYILNEKTKSSSRCLRDEHVISIK